MNAPAHRPGARDRGHGDEHRPGARLHRPRARDRGQRRRAAPAWWAPPSGSAHRSHLLEAWNSRFNLQLEGHLAIFRYEDRPGMLGRVGTALGEEGINIVSAAVGRGSEDGNGGEATMVVTADSAVPQDVVDRIASTRRLRGRAHDQPLSRRAGARHHRARAARGAEGPGAPRSAARARARCACGCAPPRSTSPTCWPRRPLPRRAGAAVRGRVRDRRRGGVASAPRSRASSPASG